MKRIVKIEGVGSIAFPDSMSDAEVSQAAGRLYDDANSLANAPQANDPKKSSDEDTSDWRRIQTSDKKHFLIHPEDLPEAQRRDPKLKILDQPAMQNQWIRVQFADGSVYEIHPADVDQALQRNPCAKVG